MKSLILRLQKDPSIKEVFFDKNGGWLFVPNTNHTIKKSREEVIAHWESLPPEAETKEESNDSERIRLLIEENELLTTANEQAEADKDEAEQSLEAAGQLIEKLKSEKSNLEAGISILTSENESLKQQVQELESKFQLVTAELETATKKKK